MYRIVLALLLILAATSARAQSWLDQPGVAGTTVIDIGAAHIHLPPGDWVKVAEDMQTYKAERVTLAERVYVQTIDGKVSAVAYVSANSDAMKGMPNGGIMANKDCFRDDVFMSSSLNVRAGQWDCMLVNHLFFRWASTPQLWQQAKASVAEMGGLPDPAIYASFAEASPARDGYAVLRVIFNPALAGFTSDDAASWAASEWQKDRLSPQRKAYMERIAAWAAAYRPVFEESWK